MAERPATSSGALTRLQPSMIVLVFANSGARGCTNAEAAGQEYLPDGTCMKSKRSSRPVGVGSQLPALLRCHMVPKGRTYRAC
jgi:hypothetical protein